MEVPNRLILATFANEALAKLEEQYGATTPARRQFQAPIDRDRYYCGLEVLQALNQPMTVAEFTAELEFSTDEVRNLSRYLATFDRVRRDDDTICRVKYSTLESCSE